MGTANSENARQERIDLIVSVTRLGELLDAIDGQARRPGEPPLRKGVADHAREQLRAMDIDEHIDSRIIDEHIDSRIIDEHIDSRIIDAAPRGIGGRT